MSAPWRQRISDSVSARRWTGRVAGVAVVSLFVSVGGVSATPANASTDPCAAPVNVIACENSQPGTPQSVWDINGVGDADIQGFATDISVDLGQRIDFKINTTASAYTIDIYRLGWYGGNGARKVASVTPSVSLPQSQPACVTDPTTEVYEVTAEV